ANSIGVSEDLLAKNPEVVKKFVRAALKGWKDALADPEEAARIEIQFVKALDPQIVVEEIQILKRIAITPDVEKNGFGYISTDRNRRLHQQQHRGIRRQAHGGTDLPSRIPSRGSDQAVRLGQGVDSRVGHCKGVRNLRCISIVGAREITGLTLIHPSAP